MSENYHFRREDTGELIEVDFVQMMQMDVTGCIELEDGTRARRVREPAKPATVELGLNKPIISDAMGFLAAQLGDFEQDRIKNGFVGVEFITDPQAPQTMQVKCSSRSVWERYVRHRGLRDGNSRNGSGASVSQAELDRLRDELLEKYPILEKEADNLVDTAETRA